ncbi:MAG: FAD binding domain-containing protein [Deltaproteobacteria bacterium]|nr:FAD binding domain-containing protein [Deltaproteobacteria bacterium]
MRLPKFRYLEPKSLEEASAMLWDDPGAKIFAGGTDLLVNMKHRVEVPAALVNLKKVKGLDTIRTDNGTVRIGALTPLKKIYQDPVLSGKFPVLAQAAAAVGSYHHQVMGTLGGNLCQQNRCKFFNQSQWWRSANAPCLKVGGQVCHVVQKQETCYSSYCGDLAPALLVLEARLLLKKNKAAREIPLPDFYSGDGKAPLALERGEVLTEIIIPAAEPGSFSNYVKFANRESIDFPIVGLALQTSPERKEYRLAFTAVDRRPVRGQTAETFLNGKTLSPDVAEEAARLASKDATPVKNSLYAPAYKRMLMGRLLQSVLTHQKEEN